MRKPVATRANANTQAMAHMHYVVRLPVELAARLEALCAMNPHKRRNQIIGELLGLGLIELERRSHKSVEGSAEVGLDPCGPIYLPNGDFSEFHDLVHKHHYALEQALARPGAEPESPEDAYRLGDME